MERIRSVPAPQSISRKGFRDRSRTETNLSAGLSSTPMVTLCPVDRQVAEKRA
jgi:hypothetical protein